MKKIIILLAVLFLLVPGFALADSTNIFPAPNRDHLLIITTTDDGDVRMSNAHKVYEGGYIVYDDQGNSKMVNDFSRSYDRGDGKDRD